MFVCHRLRRFNPLVPKLDATSLNNLYCISIWVVRKRQAFHTSTIWFFLETISHLTYTVARRINIIHQESNVAKTLPSLLVSIVVFKVCIRLSAMIMGQLENRPEHHAQFGLSLRIRQRRVVHTFIDIGGGSQKEVAKVTIIFLAHDRHSKRLVEWNGLTGIFDSHHGLRKIEEVGYFIGFVSLYNLHPIPIWIIRKSQALHSPLIRLLLKRNTRLFQFLASRIHIIRIECHVTKPVLLLIPRVILLRRILLRAIIPRQLERRALDAPHVIVCLLRSRSQAIFFSLRQRREEK
mmetsp:Transcript_15856/g.33515  ORF Transcript_15856/g.33515 Transcript_15856/m.33515 type:complete len:293 (-) Transcript_15856:254-1132(-)